MGTKVAKSCKVALDEIILYVNDMCTMIKETAHSSHEQAKGVAEINKAMGQIDTVTAQNAHSSRECSEAANYLMSEVESTRSVIDDLLKVINGKEIKTPSDKAVVYRSSSHAEVKDKDFDDFAA
jgi:methyl-accepting chemotaxis protein